MEKVYKAGKIKESDFDLVNEALIYHLFIC